jgi:hypothetical protein
MYGGDKEKEGKEEKGNNDGEVEESGGSKKRKKKVRNAIVYSPFSLLIHPTGRSAQARQETQDFQVQRKAE